MAENVPGKVLNQLDIVNNPVGAQTYAEKDGRPVRAVVGGPGGIAVLGPDGKIPGEDVGPVGMSQVARAFGYEDAVPFRSGLTVSETTAVIYGGKVYAPDPGALPFTTTGTFDPAQWWLVQGLSVANLAAAQGAAMVGFLQDGGGAVPQTTLEKLRQISRSPYDYGAVGDGVTDDTDALEKWLAAIENYGYRGVTGYGQFKITRKLYLPYPASIDFTGSRILCAALTEGAAMRLRFTSKLSPDSTLIGDMRAYYPGLNLVGKYVNYVYGDETFHVTGLEIGTHVGSTELPVQNVSFPEIKITGFKRCIEFLEQTWCLWFTNCFIGAAWDRALSMERHRNSGENIRFKGGTIFNCQNSTNSSHALFVAKGSSIISQTSFYFDGTSFDYNDYNFYWDAIEGQLIFNECHIESDLATPFGVQDISHGHNYVMLRDCTIVDNSPKTGGLTNGRYSLFKIKGNTEGTFRVNGGVLTLYARGPFVFDLSEYTGDRATKLAIEFKPGHLISGGGHQARISQVSRTVRNGNFENGTAAGWATDSAKATLTVVGISEKAPLIGSFCGKIVSTETGGYVNYFTDKISVSAGQLVKAIVGCSFVSASPSNAFLYIIEFFAFDGTTVLATSNSPVTNSSDAGATEWHDIVHQAIAPPGSVSYRIRTRLSPSGTVYIGGVDAFVL